MIVKEYFTLEDVKEEIVEFESKNIINIFFKYHWLKNWLEYFGKNSKVLILCFYNEANRELLGFVPLYYKPSKFLSSKSYKIIGHGMSNYLNLPIKEDYKEETYIALFKYLSKIDKSFIINFHDISNNYKDFLILNRMLDKYKGKKNFLYYCPYSELNNDWDEFFKRHHLKSRRKLYKYKKKLDTIGKIELIRINSYDMFIEHKNKIFDTFTIHEERFKNILNTSMYSNLNYRHFYLNIIEEFCRSKDIDLSILCIDDTTVAFSLDFKQGDTFIGYLQAFDSTFSKYSLGNVHLLMLFEELCNSSHIQKYDFTKGKATYKSRWSDEVFENYQFIFKIGNSFNLKYIVSNTFSWMKRYGRKKGWNTKIKKILAKFINKKVLNDNRSIHIEEIKKQELASIINNRNNVIKDFKYHLIKDLKSEVKKFILDLIYYGNKIRLVYENDVLTYVIDENKDTKCFILKQV